MFIFIALMRLLSKLEEADLRPTAVQNGAEASRKAPERKKSEKNGRAGRKLWMGGARANFAAAFFWFFRCFAARVRRRILIVFFSEGA